MFMTNSLCRFRVRQTPIADDECPSIETEKLDLTGHRLARIFVDLGAKVCKRDRADAPRRSAFRD
jgi:hypothetical protein